MCLLFVYINPKPKPNQYKVLLVNNRDELYSRPTLAATMWENSPKIIAGQDLMAERAGGTWLGLAESGRIASLLNIFQPKENFKDPNTVEGRGFLVVDYLRGELSAEQYMQGLASSQVHYNSFSLVAMEPAAVDEQSSGQKEADQPPYSLIYFNNIEKEVVRCGTGAHGFGNSFLSKPFNKVLKGKQKLEQIIDEVGLETDKEDRLIQSLMKMMQDREQCWPDETLSSQGKGYAEVFTRNLSSTWVTIPVANYGTRTTTVVMVDDNNRAVFRERTMKEPVDPNNIQWQQSDFTLPLVC